MQLAQRGSGRSPTRAATREEVRGPGVVGQTPVIAAGESFSYTSGCPLRTPSGIMVGSYQMADEARRAVRHRDSRLLARQPVRASAA